jgi:hypothetical protein
MIGKERCDEIRRLAEIGEPKSAMAAAFSSPSSDSHQYAVLE